MAYEINVYTDQPHKMAGIDSALNLSILDAFNTAGIEIMSPNYIAQRDGNTSTVPKEFLPEDYQSPSFKVNLEK